ncbi:MAG: site-2 protease family protein [Planctomycetota bacterium]
MDTYQIITVALVIGVMIISLSVHEAAHAFAADRLGDDTARQQGRLTLNPLDHIDPVWTIMVPLFLWYSTSGAFVFGGARPVPVNPYRLRNPSRDMAIVAAAGPASNLLQALVFMVVLKSVDAFGHYPQESLIFTVLVQAVLLNVFLALFNLIPIPPLDGSRIVRHVLPASAKDGYDRLEQVGILLVILLLYVVPGVRGLLSSMTYTLWDWMWTLTGGSWA